MREIKFRAWDAEEKDWLCIKHLGVMNNGLWYVQAIDKNEKDIDPPYFIDDKDLKLTQYTGLKDKNGVEIYEGDILRRYSFQDRQIKFLNGSFVAVSVVKVQEINWRPMPIVNVLDFEFEVIGNIYENPELLLND